MNLRQNQEDNARQIHRQRAPADPAIIDQARDHEGNKADRHPVGLLAPELGGDRVVAHVSRAVDRDDAEDRQREHVHEQEPIQAEQVFAGTVSCVTLSARRSMTGSAALVADYQRTIAVRRSNRDFGQTRLGSGHCAGRYISDYQYRA